MHLLFEVYNFSKHKMTRKQKILIIFIISVSFLARIIPGARTIDDSYITFRYARNILAGNGFVFNPGEMVQGTTTPLYTLLMAGIGSFWGTSLIPFPQISMVVNAIADSITCVLIFLIGSILGSPIAGAAASLCWAIAPFSVTFAIGGLETSLYILLLTGVIWSNLKKNTKTTALLAVLSILTRPDAIILIGFLILDRLFRAKFKNEKIHITEVLIFILPGVIWVGFAWIYFGSIVPHSVQAKLAVYRLEPYSSFIRIIQHYALLLMQNKLLGNTMGVLTGLVLVPFLYIIGAAGSIRKNLSILPAVIYPWLYLLVFSIPNPLIFRWYLTPPTPALLLFVLIGADYVCTELLKSRLFRKYYLLSNVFKIMTVIIIPLFLILSNWTLHPDHGLDRPAPEMAWYKLELLYKDAAEAIAPLITEKTLLAAGDVGVLGYNTPARILDTVGLNSPKSLEYYPIDKNNYVINYAIPTELILKEKPDWIVILEVYGRNTILKDDNFAEQYKLWKKLPTDIYGSEGLLIFTR